MTTVIVRASTPNKYAMTRLIRETVARTAKAPLSPNDLRRGKTNAPVPYTLLYDL